MNSKFSQKPYGALIIFSALQTGKQITSKCTKRECNMESKAVFSIYQLYHPADKCVENELFGVFLLLVATDLDSTQKIICTLIT